MRQGLHEHFLSAFCLSRFEVSLHNPSCKLHKAMLSGALPYFNVFADIHRCLPCNSIIYMVRKYVNKYIAFICNFNRYFAISSSASASICAMFSSFKAERICTVFSVKVRSLQLSNLARIAFAAMGAQEPFSIRATVRFW